MGKCNLYRFRHQELFQGKYSSTFFPEPPHHPQNKGSNFSDTQEETVNTSENLLPY